MNTITAVTTHDVRFPTSLTMDGSDAMNKDGDYSAAYVVLHTDDPELKGYGFTFTIGRGNDLCVAAAAQRALPLIGLDVDDAVADLGAVYRRLASDSQLRWLGPEKGVIHMAVGAVLNALWDLRAKRAGLPLWRLLAGLEPEEVIGLIDFRYLTDALTPDEALHILRAARPGREERIAALVADGYPAYTTTPGWLGYDDAKLARLSTEAVQDGFGMIKLKVGRSVEEDRRRLEIARRTVGPDIAIAIDANQRWDVPDAIGWVQKLADYEPYWIEEPTSPDDIVGHARIREAVQPVRVATGEHAQNRVIVKQFLQQRAIDVVQIDACRVGGVNENLAILLLAAKFGVPVCPHAGGVGLCELVQHLAMFDYVGVSGSLDGRRIEYVDHLHEHFVDPVRLRGGRYLAPTSPGFSAQLRPEAIEHYRYPDGAGWSEP